MMSSGEAIPLWQSVWTVFFPAAAVLLISAVFLVVFITNKKTKLSTSIGKMLLISCMVTGVILFLRAFTAVAIPMKKSEIGRF